MEKRMSLYFIDDICNSEDDDINRDKFNEWADGLTEDSVLYEENVSYVVLKSVGKVVQLYQLTQDSEEIYTVFEYFEWKLRMFEK
jgi:hypothetical protein